LHLGALAAAVASYLHARQSGGRWLIRVEDIDPPREIPGAADSILRTLESLALHWDGEVLWQSARIEQHVETAHALLRSGAAFRCRCSRRELRQLGTGGTYPGTCRNLNLPAADTAIRLRVDDGHVCFEDGLRGIVEQDVTQTDGDFVIVRRDRLPAYHLAVVLDDAEQEITDIVRGADLLECTPLHILLQQRLGLPNPRYWHIPLLTGSQGEKLSKRAGAPAVDAMGPATAANRVLTLLGLPPPACLVNAPPSELWQFALDQFSFDQLALQPGHIRVDG
jgi:glutamyl-Q tRNA(Asp) synthetase